MFNKIYPKNRHFNKHNWVKLLIFFCYLLIPLFFWNTQVSLAMYAAEYQNKEFTLE